MSGFSKNALGAALVGAATLVYLFEARKLPFGSIRNPEIGFLPILAGLTLLSLCLLLFAREFYRPVRERGKEADLFDEREEEGESAGFKRPLLLSAAVFAYPLLFFPLGFILSTVFLVTVSLRVMEYRGWLGSFLISIGISLVSFLVFARWLDVQLPPGILR